MKKLILLILMPISILFGCKDPDRTLREKIQVNREILAELKSATGNCIMFKGLSPVLNEIEITIHLIEDKMSNNNSKFSNDRIAQNVLLIKEMKYRTIQDELTNSNLKVDSVRYNFNSDSWKDNFNEKKTNNEIILYLIQLEIDILMKNCDNI